MKGQPCAVEGTPTWHAVFQFQCARGGVPQKQNPPLKARGIKSILTRTDWEKLVLETEKGGIYNSDRRSLGHTDPPFDQRTRAFRKETNNV